MFARKLSIVRVDPAGSKSSLSDKWIDNFAMRNFTNDAIFDDTLPVADGLMEAGNRVPIDRLQPAMEDWFRRKGYIGGRRKHHVAEEQTPDLHLPQRASSTSVGIQAALDCS